MSPWPIVLHGRVEDHQLHLAGEAHLRRLLTHVPDCPVQVVIERQHATRSVLQNALYWAAYIAPLAQSTGYTAFEMHRELKRLLLPTVQARPIVLRNAQGQVVLEDELPQDPTTTTLTKVEFSDYLDAITRWSAETLDLTIPAGHDEGV